MRDPYIAAKLAELAALVEITKLKYDRGHHWERELEEELAKIASRAKDLLALATK
jgi:hypothetical protein